MPPAAGRACGSSDQARTAAERMGAMNDALLWTLVVMLALVAVALFGLIVRLIKVLRAEGGRMPAKDRRSGKGRGGRPAG